MCKLSRVLWYIAAQTNTLVACNEACDHVWNGCSPERLEDRETGRLRDRESMRLSNIVTQRPNASAIQRPSDSSTQRLQDSIRNIVNCRLQLKRVISMISHLCNTCEGTIATPGTFNCCLQRYNATQGKLFNNFLDGVASRYSSMLQ